MNLNKKAFTGIFMIMMVVSFIMVSTINPSFGEESFKYWLEKADGTHYQQPEYKLVDPRSDAYLIKKLDQVPMKLVKAIFKIDDYNPSTSGAEEIAVKEAEIEEFMEDDDNVKGKKIPINIKRLLNAYKKIIQDNPHIILKKGQEHEWCPEAQKYMYYGFWDRLGKLVKGDSKDIPAPLLLRSKLFLMLACGYTFRYATTGHETDIENIIMAYRDRSFRFHDAFRESYKINNGNMYLTMLCLENLFAKNPYAENRSEMPMQKKLIYVRNDSKDKGDNYGAWYHFHGIALYGMIRSGVIARAVAEIESLGSIVLEGFDRQEDYINRYGAKFGTSLRKMIDKGTYWEPLTVFDRTDYMINNEFKKDKDESTKEYLQSQYMKTPVKLRKEFTESTKRYVRLEKKRNSWLSFVPGYGSKARKEFNESLSAMEIKRTELELEKKNLSNDAKRKLNAMAKKKWELYLEKENVSSLNFIKKARKTAKFHMANRIYTFSLKYNVKRQEAINNGNITMVKRLDKMAKSFKKNLLRKINEKDTRKWWQKLLSPSVTAYKKGMIEYTEELKKKKIADKKGNLVTISQLKTEEVFLEEESIEISIMENSTDTLNLNKVSDINEAFDLMQGAYLDYVEIMNSDISDKTLIKNKLGAYLFYRKNYEELVNGKETINKK